MTIIYTLQSRLEDEKWTDFLTMWRDQFVYLFTSLRPGACQRVIENAGQMLKNIMDNYLNKLSTVEARAAHVLDCFTSMLLVIKQVDAVKLDIVCGEKWAPYISVAKSIRDTATVLGEEAVVQELTQLVSVRGPKNFETIQELHPFVQSRPASLFEDRLLSQAVAATLGEIFVFLSGSDVDAFLEKEKATVTATCIVGMASTPDDQQWAVVVSALSLLVSLMDEAEGVLTPQHGHELLHKLKTAQAAYRQAGDQAVVFIDDAEAKETLEKFVFGTGSDVILKADAVMQKVGGMVLDSFVTILKTTVHEVGQIAAGASGHGHWSLGCEDITHQAICKHYNDSLKDNMAEISVKATKLMQDRSSNNPNPYQ